MAEMINKRFGRLVVVAKAKPSKGRHLQYKCRCACGSSVVVRGEALRAGNTKSCGCLQAENVSKASRKHGHGYGPNGRSSSTYKSWENMHARCYNEKHKHYEYYGGRGIEVCLRWRAMAQGGKPGGFERFLKDKGVRPPLLTLDRIDPDGNYTPSNTRWATRKEQIANRRISRNGFANV